MKDQIIPDDAVELGLAQLFGTLKTHQRFSQSITSADWKAWCRRLVHQLDRYVHSNIVFTDAVHRTDVEQALDLLRKAIDSPGRETALVLRLTQLVLLLLGQTPNHWQRKHVGHAAHYRLDKTRSVHYSQNIRQRARLIYDAYQRAAWTTGMDTSLAPEIKERYFKSIYPRPRHAQFVEWFRTQHPGEHAKLFG